MLRPLSALLFLAVSGCATPPPAPVIPVPLAPSASAPPPSVVPQQPGSAGLLTFDAVTFDALEGWSQSDSSKALEAFRRSCVAILDKAADASLGGAGYAGTVLDWRDACHASLTAESRGARQFFQTYFSPMRVSQGTGEGFFTGYYEPQLLGSRTRHGRFQTPIYSVPSDLVRIDGATYRDTASGEGFAGRMMMSMMMMRYVPYPARAEIERDGIPALPLFYVDDPIDAFFLQVQGSGRVALDDGTVVRAAYAGQNGQPYTAIGSVLLERGELTREELSLQSIKAWLLAHPDQARDVMNANESYVFFSEQPIGDPELGAAGAEGVPLSPGASLAVDASVHAFGTPVWLEGAAPDPDPARPDRIFDQLLIAQDTGGAIRGPLRGDVYWGIGPEAAAIAGRMKNPARMTVLLPNSVAARLGPHTGIGAR